MQRGLVDAISKNRADLDASGFFVMTDDALLNLGQLTIAASALACEFIFRPTILK